MCGFYGFGCNFLVECGSLSDRGMLAVIHNDALTTLTFVLALLIERNKLNDLQLNNVLYSIVLLSGSAFLSLSIKKHI